MVRYDYIWNKSIVKISKRFDSHRLLCHFHKNSVVDNEKAIYDGIQELIQNEDINIGDENNGYTALHWSAIKGVKFIDRNSSDFCFIGINFI